MGRQRHCAWRNRPRYCHAARPRWRPAGSRAVQPRPAVRRADRGRSASRPHRRRDGRQVGRGDPPEGNRRAPALSTATGGACRSISIPTTGPGIRSRRSSKAGLPEPKNIAEFVAAAPKLKEAGIIPFAVGGDGNGWQIQLLFQNMVTEALGVDNARQDVTEKSAEIAGGPEMNRRVYSDCARSSSSPTRATPTATGTTRPISSSPTRRRCRSWATGRAASLRLRA